MPPVAHIGNIPVEEWLPFLVPVIAIYLYVRRRERGRRAQVQRMLDMGGVLDDRVVQEILGRWSEAKHGELAAEHARLLSPPGADGATVSELAQRLHAEVDFVAGLVDDLAELGYAEWDDDAGTDIERSGADRRVWLTADGFALAHVAEQATLAAFAAARS